MSHLHRPTLVLNKSWLPFNIESAKEAITKLVARDAHVIDSNYIKYEWDEWVEMSMNDDKGPFIYSSRIRVKVPDVILLSKYNKIPKINVRLTRRNLFIRDKSTCQYSGKRLSMDEATIDHVMPRSKGGKSTWDNLVICDLDVNIKKGDRTPQEAGLFLKKTPKKPKWNLMYAKYVKKIPRSWEKFIHTDQWNEIGYWDVELID